ncbi:MAG: phosphoglycerate dehydrogenase [Leptospiraceae bacterium]|nr:phosphoglycerate dehydrogenase [Leptospiraceae bacterium]
MYKILTLNNISSKGLEKFPRKNYEISSEVNNPDAILLRSFKMHDYEIPETVKAVGRAGAGVNNIPIDKLSAKGIPVFNTPGANANAVAELVLAAMLIGSRNICQGWDFANKLEGTDAEISKAVESGKKNFVGMELPGKTLGVVGLGAIGVKVANNAMALGMNVIGYDPVLTVERALELSSGITKTSSIDELLTNSDYISFHVPLNDNTKGLLNSDRLKRMKDNLVIMNFARGGIVDDDAILAGLKDGKVYSYICDFPSNKLKTNPRVIALPHLGASTEEAEENCALMVGEQIRDFLENGNIRNSVNFPEVFMARGEGHRISIANSNVPNMVGQISSELGKKGINIIDMLNRSMKEYAYTLLDVDQDISDDVINHLKGINGVLAVRKH